MSSSVRPVKWAICRSEKPSDLALASFSASMFKAAAMRPNFSPIEVLSLGDGLDIQLDDDLVANQVIGFARVLYAEIEPLDEELGFQRGLVAIDAQLGGETNLFGDTVQRQVAGQFHFRALELF